MGPIQLQDVQTALDRYANQDLYLHLETTVGAYAAHRSEKTLAAGAYIRNGKIRYERGVIIGSGPYRVGLKIELGWVYAEGLTDWEIDSEDRILLAGHDVDGRLAVALELSQKPFRV